MTGLGTIITAMITPYNDRNEVDYDEAMRIAQFLVDRGNDGLVVAGSTGEGMALDATERTELVRAVKKAVAGRAAVIPNAGTSDTRSSVRNAKDLYAAGADGLLAVVPPYVKPTQNGMLAHFGAIADATPLPIMIYNIPGRTAQNMLPETLLSLARNKRNVVGVKESSGDMNQIGQLIRDRDDGFKVWCGDDYLFLPCLALGADGVVGVASHLCSPQYVEMLDAYRAGNVTKAAHLAAELLTLINALFATTNPIAIKWAMNQIGFKTGSCRLPLDVIPPAVAERLKPLITHYAAAPVS